MKRSSLGKFVVTVFLLLSTALPDIVIAQETPMLDSGDTAWMLTSTALVLFMTIPGLSLFYAGMVRSTELSISSLSSRLNWVLNGMKKA